MKIFADTASLSEIEELDEHPWVSGFTTNPTLAKNAGVTSTIDWAKEIVRVTAKPVSIDGWPFRVWALGPNAIPKLVWRPNLTDDIRKRPINWTAVVTARQTTEPPVRACDIISVFAGRIMDTGRDPQPVIDAAKATGAQVLWASTREVYNYVQAENAGCDIITMSAALIRKLEGLGKPLETVAAETAAQFEADRVDW